MDIENGVSKGVRAKKRGFSFNGFQYQGLQCCIIEILVALTRERLKLN